MPAATTLRTHPELKAERAASHEKRRIGPKEKVSLVAFLLVDSHIVDCCC